MGGLVDLVGVYVCVCVCVGQGGRCWMAARDGDSMLSGLILHSSVYYCSAWQVALVADIMILSFYPHHCVSVAWSSNVALYWDKIKQARCMRLSQAHSSLGSTVNFLFLFFLLRPCRPPSCLRFPRSEHFRRIHPTFAYTLMLPCIRKKEKKEKRKEGRKKNQFNKIKRIKKPQKIKKKNARDSHQQEGARHTLFRFFSTSETALWPFLFLLPVLPFFFFLFNKLPDAFYRPFP